MKFNRLFSAAAILAALGASGTASAHYHTAYSHEPWLNYTAKNWMASISDSTPLSNLSLPGTHNSMALYGGASIQTQSLSLEQQLNSGIRVLDIRVRQTNDAFAIHHGIKYQKAMFGDVLQTLRKFLKENPREVVLMRVKKEQEPNGNNRLDFYGVFKKYKDQYSDILTGAVWEGQSLGSVRGKVIVLRDFPEGDEGFRWSQMNIQDNYHLKTNWSLHGKWLDVKKQLETANIRQSWNNRIYVNFLSGSGGSFPYFVASGHTTAKTSGNRLSTGVVTRKKNKNHKYQDFPLTSCFMRICTVSFEGTNILADEYIRANGLKYVGIVMSDFPGRGLINTVIRLNDGHKRSTASSAFAPPPMTAAPVRNETIVVDGPSVPVPAESAHLEDSIESGEVPKAAVDFLNSLPPDAEISVTVDPSGKVGIVE